MGSTANTDHELNLSKTIEKNGYIYVYVSNESNNSFDVYFDDLRITHTKGKVIQEDHYYPFGLNISALSSRAPLSKPNKYNTFQGQERTEDFDLGWYSFKWRNHDPTIGRFFNVDPLAEKYLYNSPYAFSENKVTSHSGEINFTANGYPGLTSGVVFCRRSWLRRGFLYIFLR